MNEKLVFNLPKAYMDLLALQQRLILSYWEGFMQGVKDIEKDLKR